MSAPDGPRQIVTRTGLGILALWAMTGLERANTLLRIAHLFRIGTLNQSSLLMFSCTSGTGFLS